MRRDRWPLYLVMGLMTMTGVGWFAWAAATRGLIPERWGWPWPPGLIPAVGIVHFAAALGLWRRRPWAWMLALAYMCVGAASLLSQVAARFLPVHHFLFVLGSVALLAAPYLLRHRREFFAGQVYAAQAAGWEHLSREGAGPGRTDG